MNNKTLLQAALCVAALMIVMGCSERSDPHPGIQINDSLMYISANPITGKPVTFWHSLSESRRKLLREMLTYRYGASGITLTPKGGEPVVLSDVVVSNARLTRRVTIKQGDSVLYAREEGLTQENLDRLCSCTVVSTEWEDIPLREKDVAFSVDYWRSYETEYGGGGDMVVSDLVMIPVRKK